MSAVVCAVFLDIPDPARTARPAEPEVAPAE
jgi:hypothetical protein